MLEVAQSMFPIEKMPEAAPLIFFRKIDKDETSGGE
jgi:hypothetical protein